MPPPRKDELVGFSKKFGFTLTEVLITLGIIGVVAAITIPSVIRAYKINQIETRLKKVYSEMNQAVTMSIANDTWTEPPLASANRYNNNVLLEWLNTALFPYFKGIEIHPPYTLDYKSNYFISSNTLSKRYVAARFPNGSLMFFDNNVQIHIYYDVNGEKGPNKGGVDLFRFFLDYKNDRGAAGYFYPSGYVYDYDNSKDLYVYGNRAQMLQYCRVDMNSSCSLLIMNDGWKVSKDYPIRL